MRTKSQGRSAEYYGEFMRKKIAFYIGLLIVVVAMTLAVKSCIRPQTGFLITEPDSASAD